MKNLYMTKLKFISVLIAVIGLLLVISLVSMPSIVDKSILVGLSEQLFILFAGLIVFVALIFIVKNLHKEKKDLEFIEQVKPVLDIPKAEITIDPIDNRIKGQRKEPEKEEEDPNLQSRFFMISELDKLARKNKIEDYNNEVTLEEMCDEFRNYAAGKLGLYYDIDDIRRFVGGLAVSHIMILQGMSGTGKTSLAYAFGEYLNNSSIVVPIQPMWKERTDLIGYYNEFTKKFNETTLLQKLYGASHDEQIYVTILDEMNIARVEYYFAEFLSLLEIPDTKKRYLDVISDVWETDPELLNDGKLILPNNMWFVGTANNDDSTFAISDKVYDRAMVMNLDKRANTFISSPVERRRVSATKYEELVEKAKKEFALSHRNLRRLKQLDKYLMQAFHITFGNRIMQQIINYTPVIVACGGSELSALDDILSKKVLRKLETKNMVYVKSAAPGLIAYIEELFGDNEMELCKEYIRNVEINA